MADGGHHREGEHDERDTAMPAMPGSRFVMIETELVLGGLEALFDRPAESPATHLNGTPAVTARVIISTANRGLVAKPRSRNERAMA